MHGIFIAEDQEKENNIPAFDNPMLTTDELQQQKNSSDDINNINLNSGHVTNLDLAKGPLDESAFDEEFDLGKQQFWAMCKMRLLIMANVPALPCLRLLLPMLLVVCTVLMLKFITPGYKYDTLASTDFDMWPQYHRGPFLYQNNTGRCTFNTISSC